MASKLDSPARQVGVQPKLSIFGAKPGFVIPKNRIPASMLIRKNETSPTAAPKDKQDYTKPPPLQRKTKWGPDLTSDPSVRKSKALAYQVRVEQITKELESGTLEMGRNEDSLSTAIGSNSDGAHNQTENEQGRMELLELEKREIVGEILQLIPGYKAPDDYKPLLKETKIFLPTKAHPGHNIIGVLIGPERNTLKRLQEETGAKIRVYGTKKGNGQKSEVRQPDIHEGQAVYEDLYIHVSADSYDKVDAAVSLIELLLTTVPIDLTDASETATISLAVTSGGINPADVQQVHITTSQPGLHQYQSHNAHWLPTFQTNVPSTGSSGPTPITLPNNTLQLQPLVGSFSMPPYTGQPPHMNFMPRNTLSVPGSQPPLLNIQQPSHQFQANPSAGPSFGRPPGNAYNSQAILPSTVPLSLRPLQTPHASGGWPPTFSPVMVHSQRPSQGAPAFMPMRPPISVSPLGAAPLLQGSVPSVPSQLNLSTSYGRHPPGANFGLSATSHSTPLGTLQPFPPVSSSPVGASVQPPYPLSMQMRPLMSAPPQMRHPPSLFAQVGPAPGNGQVAHSSHPPASMLGLSSSGAASTCHNQTSIAALRPPRPATGDFTFRPHVPLSANFSASGSQVAAQANIAFSSPQAPLFRPANPSNTLAVQGFQRPLDGSFMGQPRTRMHAPPPHFPGAFPGNPSALQSPRGFRPAIEPSDQSNRMRPGPFHFLPPPQQNPYLNANREDSSPNPIYDPFVPTAVSGATKADSEFA